MRALIELPDGLDEAGTVTEAGRLAAMLDGVEIPLLLHGEGSSCWRALVEAGRRVLATRIGLEDTVVMPDGSEAVDNAALVTTALSVLGRQAPGVERPAGHPWAPKLSQ